MDSGFENTSLHPNASLFRHFITRENIIGILEERGALESPDFLSVDIDYNDFWVLDTILCAFAPFLLAVVARFKAFKKRVPSNSCGGKRPQRASASKAKSSVLSQLSGLENVCIQ